MQLQSKPIETRTEPRTISPPRPLHERIWGGFFAGTRGLTHSTHEINALKVDKNVLVSSGNIGTVNFQLYCSNPYLSKRNMLQ